MTITSETGRRSPLAWILYSPQERRLRAGWRLFIQSVLMIVFGLAFGCFALLVPKPLQVSFFDISPAPWLAGAQLAEFGAITASVWLARRLLDRRTFTSLGLRVGRRACLDLAVGIAISMVMMGSIFVIQWRLGWLSITAASWNAASAEDVVLRALGFLGIFALVGWNEELLARGYHLQTIASGLNPAAGLILSSATFGLVHLGNPHAGPAAVAGVSLAGALLGYAFLRTRHLWLPIGLHIGWNFFEGVVFGFPVSGLDTYHLMGIKVSGPSLWTGGEFGPEASLLVIPAIAIGVLLVHLWGKRYGAQEAEGSHPT